MMKLSKIFMFSISQPLAEYPSRVQHCAKLWDGKARQKEAMQSGRQSS